MGLCFRNLCARLEWQKVEILLADTVGRPLEQTSDIRINITTQSYKWAENEAPVIYLSNIYYTLPSAEPEVPVEPTPDPEPEQPQPEQPEESKGGCGSSIVGIGAAVTLLGAAAIVTMKKKED